jgi:hypothetical protein
MSSPWTREEQLQHALGGIHATLRLLASQDEPRGEEDLVELRRLIGEVLAVLPDEESRLERLAAAPAADLPRLAQALHAV